MNLSGPFVLGQLEHIAEQARTAPARARAVAEKTLADNGIANPSEHFSRQAIELGTLHAYVERIAVEIASLRSMIASPPKRTRRRR